MDDVELTGWGDVSQKVNVASVRKSLLSALYRIEVSDGLINLASNLADLRIHDKRPAALMAAEKEATVRDLLMARSGIYHVAAYETADIRQKRPERGSHAPGSSSFMPQAVCTSPMKYSQVLAALAHIGGDSNATGLCRTSMKERWRWLGASSFDRPTESFPDLTATPSSRTGHKSSILCRHRIYFCRRIREE
ncbi:hypothetical protein [Rhizobium azibense]|uniref:hypothetical protein n=1 Tax=Rhizobium azibense TaxID=1136135 RepID=UPI001FDEDD1B|nr:hypothetical protein [Rhizobium azibense]